MPPKYPKGMGTGGAPKATTPAPTAAPAPSGGGGSAVSSAPAPVAPSPSNDAAKAAPTREQLKAKYPAFAGIIDSNPDLYDVLIKAETADPPWTANEFQAAVMGTNWWRTTADAGRSYQTLQSTDPATFQTNLAETNRQIRLIASNAGYSADFVGAPHFDFLANTVMRLGLSGPALAQFVLDNLTDAIAQTPESDTLDQLRQIATQYDMDLTDADERYWAHAIQTGRQTVEDFEGNVTRATAARWPSLAKDLESGMTLRQITAPYRAQVADLMEMDPGAIDFTSDDRWRHMVAYVDPKDGTTRKMSVVEAAKYIREQPEWRRTRNALDSASQIGEQILQSFGAVRR